MIECKNCKKHAEGNYCKHCGQKTSVKRIEIKWLLHDLPHAVWHMDKGFLFNIKELFKRPGYAILDYINGKRKSYYHPLSYLLVLIGIIYLVMYNFKAHWYDPLQDVAMSESDAKDWKQYEESQQLWTQNYIPYLFIFLPVAALIYQGILRLMKVKFNYAETLVIILFSTAQIIIPQIILFLASALIDRTSVTRVIDPYLTTSLVGIYYFIQLYQLGSNRTKRLLRAVLALAGSLLLLVWIYKALEWEAIIVEKVKRLL